MLCLSACCTAPHYIDVARDRDGHALQRSTPHKRCRAYTS